ncbi:MAG: thrombospondin type 3 repeat-containing protein, partial [Fibrobacter sp.]|nr:thrombospondin type 3 repeat-containing protein [Fibrobacter sp.]
MKKFLITLASLAVVSFAQVGIGRSNAGIHVPTAETMDRGSLYISGSYEMIVDGKSLSMEGYYTDVDGNHVEIDENTSSNDETLFLSFAVIDNLEINARIPFHYDSRVEGATSRSFGLGDIEIGAKGSFTLNDMLIFGASTEIFIPLGFKGSGFRPRHRWFIDDDNKAHAYSADGLGFAAYAHGTAFISPSIRANAYIGVLRTLNTSENFSLWGLGLTFLPEKILSVILEISGETPIHSSNVAYNLLSSPLRLTPGLRMHLPRHFEITVSGDVGINYLRKKSSWDGIPVTLNSGKEPVEYTALGSPNLGIGITLSKRLNLNWADSDGDGVIDRDDMCPRTTHGMIVNEKGCPVDEDDDGVLNIVDMCPGTLIGLKVDYNGCPIDDDKDGVFDYQDKCLGTPSGFAVDSKGCTLDTDGDGIDDNNDKCPQSTPGEPVDETGCPMDEDHDGITNNLDQCPGTPEGFSIDSKGCPLDFDKDGVPDDLDKCPNTAEG